MKDNCNSFKLSVVGSLRWLMLCLLLGISSMALANQPPPPPGVSGIFNADPGSDLWRSIRMREQDEQFAGRTQVQGIDAGVLIRASGEDWRQFRMEQLVPYGGRLLVGLLIVMILFRVIRGRIKLVSGRSGNKILRFTTNQRVAHWTTAILFVSLGITGLILLFGRVAIIPLLGAEAFSYIANPAKVIHDYLGPAFAISLIFLFFLFVRGNAPSPKEDINWFIHAGGMLGDKHIPAARYNAGEKGWFWLAVLVGGTVTVSGLVLVFPNFGQGRDTMELFHMIHSIAAVAIIAASFGHIYMGTTGVEATFEVMQTGYCDENWAKEHHSIWHQEKLEKGEIIDADAAAGLQTRPSSAPEPGKVAEAGS